VHIADHAAVGVIATSAEDVLGAIWG
jgi:hypothetical protein